MFNAKKIEDNRQKLDIPKRRVARFQTQPVTSDEVETARCIPPAGYALGVLFILYICVYVWSF